MENEPIIVWPGERTDESEMKMIKSRTSRTSLPDQLILSRLLRVSPHEAKLNYEIENEIKDLWMMIRLGS